MQSAELNAWCLGFYVGLGGIYKVWLWLGLLSFRVPGLETSLFTILFVNTCGMNLQAGLRLSSAEDPLNQQVSDEPYI